MNGQRNTMLHYMTGARRPELSARSSDAMEDSSILRYIKTLTTHQTNAKQQRMDQYLRQVKHSQSTEDFNWASLGPSGLEYQRDNVAKVPASVRVQAPAPLMLKKAPLKEHRNKSGSNLTGRSRGKGAADQKKNGNHGKQDLPRTKRQFKGTQYQRQAKRFQQASNKQQIATEDSWARFRFDTAAPRQNVLPQSTVRPVHSETPSLMEEPSSAAQNQFKGKENLSTSVHEHEMLRTAEKEFDTADASTKQHPTKAYWDHPSKQHGSSDAAPINNAAWDSSNQDIHFTQPGELHPEDIHSALDAQTGIGAAYDPLSLMMTSIYF